MATLAKFQGKRHTVRDVKSRLLPLPWLVAWLERMIEALPRQLMNVSLKPSNDIAVLDAEKGQYKSTGNNPWFDLDMEPRPTSGGWYYMEAALVRNNGNRQANIYGELSGSRARSIVQPIPTNLRGSVREVFYLPPHVHTLRWTPTAAPGFFSQSPLVIHKITALESGLRRSWRVLFDLWRFSGHTAARRSGLSIWRAFRDLQEAYQSTSTLRTTRTSGIDYQAFVESSETLTKKDVRAIHQKMKEMPARPVISVIMTFCNPAPDFLAEALDSVTAQLYPHWELCLVGSKTIDPEALTVIRQRQNKDARIKLFLHGHDTDQASNFNHALCLASGEYIAVLKQHDVILPYALYFAAVEHNKYPDAQLIYSDEDCFDEAGRRIDPIFKPDWNPDLILSQNFFSNLGVYRRALVRKLGGYRQGYDGAEEYDLLLRCIKETDASQIRHIPKVLYSRRASIQNEPHAKHALQRAHRSGQRALEGHLAPTNAIVEPGPGPCLYRIRRTLPTARPLVSLIIPTRDQVELLRRCVASIQHATDYENWEMLIVDNQSEEPETFDFLQKIQNDQRIKVLSYDKPFNYSAVNNFAVQFAKGEILGLLNNDVEVIASEWLSEMVSHAVRREIGAVGAKLLYSDGTVQHAGVILGIGGVAGHVHKYIKDDDPGYCHRACLIQNLSAVTGACLVVRKQVYEEVNGLDQINLAVAFNDIDFCLKVRDAGYRNLYSPYALLYHHESITRGHDDTPKKQAIFRREYEYMKEAWGKKLQDDPAYNPNLTLESENFSFGANFAKGARHEPRIPTSHIKVAI